MIASGNYVPAYSKDCLGRTIQVRYYQVRGEEPEPITPEEIAYQQRLNNLAEWKRGSLDADSDDAVALIEELESKNADYHY